MIRTLLTLLCALAAAAALAAPPAQARVAFGAWTPGSPFAGNLRSINNLQNVTGRRVGIVHWFQDFSTDRYHFRINVRRGVRAVKKSGRRAMLTWEPYVPGPWENYRNSSITQGHYDRYIKRWARWVKKIKRPVYVRFAHEMNGNWFPWGGTVNGNSPKSFKRMWRHVVKLANRQGAHNIRWVWSPLVEDPVGVPGIKRYYPGRKYVDVLGLSGFNWGDSTPEFGGWRSFRKVFRKSYRKIKRLGPQRVWITEVGSASQGGDKAQWVRKMWATAERWKRLKAIVWYDQDKERDWSVGAVAAAFRK